MRSSPRSTVEATNPCSSLVLVSKEPGWCAWWSRDKKRLNPMGPQFCPRWSAYQGRPCTCSLALRSCGKPPNSIDWRLARFAIHDYSVLGRCR